jgi:hypothetical protein
MAIIKDPKDPQGLMRALGPGALGMSSSEENLIGDEPTFDGFEDDDNTPASKSNTTNVNKRLDNVIQLVKEISKKSGLQKDEVYKVLSQISTSLQNNVQKTLTSAMDVINPKIKRDLIEITKLLDTGNQNDQKLALKKLEDLQNKFNIDLKQYNKELGKNLDKLNEAVEKMATEKEERIEKAKQIQASELSQGRSARIDEKSDNLRYLSRDEIKAEEIKARNIEKEIVVQKKEFEKLLKEDGAFKDGKFDNAQQEKLNKQREIILKLEEKSTKIRSVIGERQPTFLQKTGEVLRGERGPEIVKQLMAPFYETFAATAKLLDDLSFGMFGKLGKKILDVGSSIFSKSFNSLSTDFSKGFTKFKDVTLNVLKNTFGPLLKNITDGLKGFGGFLKNALGMGKGTAGGAGGGITRALGMGSRALPLAGLLTGGGAAAAGGAAGGGLMAGLGGLATAAAPFLLPALGITAAVGGIGYMGKKLYDKTKSKSFEQRDDEKQDFSETYMPQDEEKNESKMRFLTDKELPYELRNDTPSNRFKRDQKEIARQRAEPGAKEFIDSQNEKNKIEGKQSEKFNFNNKEVDPAELKAESEKFMRGDEKSDKGVNLFNQNAPTINNAGDSKTVVPTSYNNPNPTFNIINTSKVF